MNTAKLETVYVQCPFCERVHRNDGPPVLCCGETKCLPVTAEEAQDLAFAEAAECLAILRAADPVETVDAERAEVERLAQWLETSPSTMAGARFPITELPLLVRLDLTLTARETNNDPKAVLAKLREHYPFLTVAA